MAGRSSVMVRWTDGVYRPAGRAYGTDVGSAAAAEGDGLHGFPAAPQQPDPVPGPGTLSARERELVTLVARGRTDAQIAAELFISIRTVRSHQDRIRDRPAAAAAPA